MNLSKTAARLLDFAPLRAARHLTGALRTQYTKPRPGEPPFVRGGIPFLGCALDYGKNAAEFLQAQRAQHGEVFTVFLAGQRMTFICDPQDYPAVLLDEGLDFHELANEISAKAFGHTLESLELIDTDAVIKTSINKMRGEDLAEMTARMQQKLEEVLLSQEPPGADGLYEFVSKVVFLASTDAIFGDDFGTEDLLDQFNVLDKQFPLLVAGVASRILPGVNAAREALFQRFAREYANASSLLLAREAMFRGVVDDRERQAYETALVWASVANTIPAAFWTLFYILNDPMVRTAIVEEVRAVISAADRDDSGRPVFDRSALSQMVRLDSAIDESFRLTSGSLVIRVAQQAKVVTLSSGREVRLRVGDQVALYPQMTHHDDAIYDDPTSFRFDRFLEDGKPKRLFMRNGERVRHYLMPFGGGVSICPGRHFARNEIKLTVALLLNDFDLHLVDSSVPPLDQSRAGLGILPPTTDVAFRWNRASA
ncbi:MAG: cytochrome P450 [Bradymonadia bacterium]|jgi:cytochrome P450